MVPIAAALGLALAAPAAGQFHDSDPAAVEALREVVAAYRERPALTVKSFVDVSATEGEQTSERQPARAEFLLMRPAEGRPLARVHLRGFIVMLADGAVTAVHTHEDEKWFTMDDGGSPYYALMSLFMDLPFPHLAIFLGEDDIDDLVMQLHPKAPWVRPTAVRDEERDGRPVRVIALTSDFEQMEIVVDPETQLLESATVDITGGHLVQPGTTLHYQHRFEYVEHEAPFPDEMFAIDASERERVDELAQLRPRRSPLPGDRRGVAPPSLVGEPAPPLTLETLDGGVFDLEEHRGSVLVLDFWATWCGPCVASMPLLHEVAEWVSEEHLPAKVIAVNVMESPDRAARLEQVRGFWQQREFTLPVAMDYADESVERYGIGGIPTIVVIRPDGTVHARHTGSPRDFVAQLQSDIRDAIEAAEAPANEDEPDE